MLTPHLDIPVKMLRIGRWDYAFDVVWIVTMDLAGLPVTIGEALTVRDSGDHALGRSFACQMADFAREQKQIPLSIGWMMLAADVTKPTTILAFVPQLMHIVALNQGEMTLQERVDLHSALEVWMDAAEGRYAKQTDFSLFTLQFTEQRKRVAPPKLSYSQTFDEPVVAEPEPDVPGVIVMRFAPAGKLQPENIAYREMVGKWFPLTLAPDLAPIRATLVAEYPHAVGAIDLLLRDLRPGQPIRINPMVLVGPPGNGKSRLVRRFSELLRVGMVRFDASNSSDSVGFGGTPRGWGGSVPSIPVRGILQYDSPSILIMIDEIEKAGTSHHNGNFLSSLTPYIERETSQRMRDPSLDTNLDLSWISYVATANTDVGLPSQIKDRFRVVRMSAPTLEHLPALVRNVLAEKAADEGIDPAWAETLEPDELVLVGAAWQKHRFSIRALQKIVSAVIDTRSALAMRH